MKQKIERWIDTVSLPKKNGRIDRIACVGHNVNFRYGDVCGTLKILSKDIGGKFNIQYMDHVLPMDFSHLLEGKLEHLIYPENYDWKYNIGDVVRKGSAVIKSRNRVDFKHHHGARCYTLQCLNCSGEYMKPERCVESSGCPICINQTIQIGINDMWTTNPEVARQLEHPEDGYHYCIGSNHKLDWRCPHCHRIIRGLVPKQVLESVDAEVPCEKCKDTYSYPNKFMFHVLEQLGVNFETEKGFDWAELGHRKYDFYVPQHMAIIEMHGAPHYQDCFPEIQLNDIEKQRIALDNGVRHYIVIDASISRAEYIWNNILQSILSSLFDLSQIDPFRIDYLAKQRVIDRVVSTGRECNFDEHKIGSILKLANTQVSTILNRATRAGLISKEEIKKAQSDNMKAIQYQLRSRPILCVDTGLVFGGYPQLEQWFSANDRPFSRGSFCKGLHEKYKLIYGYHWQQITREQFNQIKRESPEKAFGDFFYEEKE